ncbi:MAG: aminoglycoside phosphotransferase family protein, partial [Deltaproteobacteria bacterium]|nr:aminoglycoside phosphotransferase family protein [Deltaproteobacteria bacterium]
AAVWRALTYINGETVDAADSPERCAAAGRLLAVFHHALRDCAFVLRHRRLGIHDTPKHLAALHRALQNHRDHRAFAEIAPLAEAILAAADPLELPTSLPERLVHGDPKITNILFHRDTGEARCFVDLDTLARMPIALELGDALRSWCAPRGEEEPDPIDVARFDATLRAYAKSAPPATWLSANEWHAIVPATETIALELAARFATDALDERYFGWDAARFPSASAHNQRRAKAQLTLARSIRHQRDALQTIVNDTWCP